MVFRNRLLAIFVAGVVFASTSASGDSPAPFRLVVFAAYGEPLGAESLRDQLEREGQGKIKIETYYAQSLHPQREGFTAVRDGIAYVASETAGLVIVDVTDAAEPKGNRPLLELDDGSTLRNLTITYLHTPELGPSGEEPGVTFTKRLGIQAAGKQDILIENCRLATRDVTIVRRYPESVVVSSGLAEGDTLVLAQVGHAGSVPGADGFIEEVLGDEGRPMMSERMTGSLRDSMREERESGRQWQLLANQQFLCFWKCLRKNRLDGADEIADEINNTKELIKKYRKSIAIVEENMAIKGVVKDVFDVHQLDAYTNKVKELETKLVEFRQHQEENCPICTLRRQ